MLATSQNGWPVSDNPAELGVVPLVVGGVTFGGGVRGGKVHEVLSYVANAVHNRVQKANSTYGCWGYSYRANVNSPGEWSNHASATAIDFNATLHGNDQPTSESWTDAQVAEIHKILAEVGGMVRWGGDYSHTIDSMHFEVVAAPAELGGATIPAAHSVWPIGNPDFYGDWRATPELTTMSVSYPTMAAYGPRYGQGEASWFFRPVTSGRLSFDALLSHWVDDKLNDAHPLGPNVSIGLYLATYDAGQDRWDMSGVGWGNSFQGAFGLPQRSQGRFVADVIAGETYVIQTFTDPDFPYVRTVVRIGDYAIQPDWVQPPDQEFVYGQNNANRLPSAPVGSYLNMSPWGTSVGMQGVSAMAHAFAGTYPGTQPDAVACAWKYARRTQTGTYYWSTNNSGSYNGTDPYDFSVPANPTCPVITSQDVIMSAHYSDWPVGYQYYSQEPDGFLGGGYSNAGWRVFTTSCWFAPKEPTRIAGYTGVGNGYYNSPAPTYLPQLQGTEYIEWERTDSTLAGLYWSWDEVNGGGGVQSSSPVFVKWYMGEFMEDADHQPGQWGPFGETWYGDAMGEDAASWAATQQHLGDTAGGYSDWHWIPENLWTLDKIRFTAMPDRIFSDAVPDMGQDIYGLGISIYKYRASQYMAIKAVIRPSRYRVIPDPGIEDLDWAGVNAISIAFDDSGKVLY